MAAIVPDGQPSWKGLAPGDLLAAVIPRLFRHLAALTIWTGGFSAYAHSPMGERPTAVSGARSRIRGRSGETVKGGERPTTVG
jgi:hypothetical protein